ncbi:MAG: GNAT family N-acetyltransferase [Deltaproteobacteria bacterium]|nr:GNAT family N-acetyltransferase [Deltaproteobacteria bacterium]
MKVIETIERDFWEEIARNCPYATFFHTPYWSDLMAKTFSYLDMTKGFLFDNGTSAVFPFMREKSSALRRALGWDNYISGAAYTYGGPISDRPLSQGQLDELDEYIGSMVKRHHILVIRGNPFAPKNILQGFKKIEDVSHVVELLKCKNENDLMKEYHKRNRDGLKKNLRDRVLEIRKADSLDEYKELYKIYLKSTTHWERLLTNYPFTLFQNIYELKSEHIRLWTTYFKKRMIGGEIMLYWNDYCTGFVSYYDREYSKLQGRQYMLHHVFMDCLAKEIKYYDFRQSGGVKGVADFKRRMGGIVYFYSAWIKENRIAKAMAAIKKALA